jgi:hypothetical protein
MESKSQLRCTCKLGSLKRERATAYSPCEIRTGQSSSKDVKSTVEIEGKGVDIPGKEHLFSSFEYSSCACNWSTGCALINGDMVPVAAETMISYCQGPKVNHHLAQYKGESRHEVMGWIGLKGVYVLVVCSLNFYVLRCIKPKVRTRT